MINIILYTIFGICLAGLVVMGFLFFKLEYQYRQVVLITTWVHCYQVITDKEDIDYNICNYVEESWDWLFNPFCWSRRSMCDDKEKYDKLKEFIDNNIELIEPIIIDIVNDPRMPMKVSCIIMRWWRNRND